MNVVVENDFEFQCDLRREPHLAGSLLDTTVVTCDIADLVEELAINAILGERLPADCGTLRARVRPVFNEEPLVEKLEIELSAEGNGRAPAVTQQFTSGRWVRTAQRRVLQLREEGTIDAAESVYRLMVALKHESGVPVTVPPVQPPSIVAATLEECGVRGLGDGSLAPDRPVLVNERFEAEAIQRCADAGPVETGAAVAGRTVRLPEPLPGTESRIVTILSSMFHDPRHVGDETRFHFSPPALAEAQQLCELRGLGEGVVTVFHTHGWSSTCGNCNQNPDCPLAESNPSHQDYQLLETLFPGKSTLMPIAGRKLGEAVRHPVLQIHAWRAGQMRPVRWRKYND